MNYDPSSRRPAPGKEPGNKPAPTNPVVLVASGELGSRVVELLSGENGVAEELGVRIRGQFGLAQIASRSEADRKEEGEGKSSKCELATSIFFGINDRTLEPPQHLWSGAVSPADDRWRQVAANLLRRICPLASDRADFRVAPETNYDIYLLIDLRDRAAVLGALRFAQAITCETTHFEMTAILLTGRSSLPEQKNAEAWRLGLKEIVAAHDKGSASFGSLFHRAYLLDGVNSRRAWLDSPESLCMLAARFLLQHGFSPYRRWLRMHEQSRLSEGQEFREVLGSFAIRHITCGIESIAEELTDVLSADCPFASAPPSEDNEAAELAVKDFELQVEGLLQKEYTLTDIPTIRETVMNQVGKAVAEAARENPVSRIVCLLEKLEHSILRLHSRVHVQEHMHDRRGVSEPLRVQVQRVDDLGRPRNVVPPVQPFKPPRFLRIPLPISRAKLIWGLVILGIGAIAGCFLHEGAIWPLIASFLVMSVGALTVDMPNGFWRNEKPYKTWLGLQGVSTEQVDFQRYRDHNKIPTVTARDLPSAGFVIGGVVLILLGLGLAIYSLRIVNLAVEPAEFLMIGLLAAVAAGMALYQPRHQPGLITPPPTPRDTSVEGLLADRAPEGPQIVTVSEYPPAYFPGSWGVWRFFWAIVLTSCLGVAVINWQVDLRNTPYPWPENLSPDYAPHAVRLAVLLIGGGLTLLVWPQSGDHACGQVERPLDPELRDIPASVSVKEEVDICLLDTLDWIRSLWTEAQEVEGRDYSDWSERGTTEKTFLDVIDAEWKDKLAAACSPYLETRGKLTSDWAEFVKAEIAKGPSEINRHNFARMFTYRCVQKWLSNHLREHDWSHLMLLLQPKATWLGRYFERELAPMWPVGAAPLALDTGAALVDSRLKMAATAQEVTQQTPWRFRGVHWPENGDKRGLVVLVRMVQGLPLNDLLNLLPTNGE